MDMGKNGKNTNICTLDLLLFPVECKYMADKKFIIDNTVENLVLIFFSGLPHVNHMWSTEKNVRTTPHIS